MAFCGKCGAQVQDSVNFCPACGHTIFAAPAQTRSQEQYQAPQQGYVPPVVPGAPQQTGIQDAQQNKTMGILAYILFFIPMFTGAHKTSPFVKYHVNQGCALFIIAVAYCIISSILSAAIKVPRIALWGITAYYATPGWLVAILWLLSIPIFILCVVGILNAVNGKMQPLPVIGKFNIIK